MSGASREHDAEVPLVRYHPTPDEFAWTFGGVAPVTRIRPGDAVALWTEDCYAGNVRGPDDLVSKVCELPFDPVDQVALRCGLDRLDAYQLVSQLAESPIANVCNPTYSVVGKIRKGHLPGNDDPYRGAHARLREMADLYRRVYA